MSTIESSSINYRGNPERYFIAIVIGLVLFGLVMLYSASFIVAQEKYQDGYMLLKKQGVGVFLGIVMMFAMTKLSVDRLIRLLVPTLVVMISLLIMVRIPGLGLRAGGAWRWLKLGPLQVQPAEFAKYFIVFFAAYNLTKDTFHTGITSWIRRLAVPACLLALVYLQPDFGTIALVSICLFLMLFLAGCPMKYLLSTFSVLIPAAAFLVWNTPYRRARVLAFLNPWSNAETSGFQILQSFVAFRSGGLDGVGLGNSQEKLHFLPAAHNDFVLSVISEELGFIGLTIVLSAFLTLIFLGFRIGTNAKHPFHRLVAIGFTLIIGVQAFLNAGVVLGVLPTKGITLPFISYGGSSIVATLTAVGIVLRIAKESKKPA